MQHPIGDWWNAYNGETFNHKAIWTEIACEYSRTRVPNLVFELENTLRAAVLHALLGNVPRGTLCSGGVDSSLVMAFRGRGHGWSRGFSAGYKGDSSALNERPAVEKVAHTLGVELDLMEVTQPGSRSGSSTPVR